MSFARTFSSSSDERTMFENIKNVVRSCASSDGSGSSVSYIVKNTFVAPNTVEDRQKWERAYPRSCSEGAHSRTGSAASGSGSAGRPHHLVWTSSDDGRDSSAAASNKGSRIGNKNLAPEGDITPRAAKGDVPASSSTAEPQSAAVYQIPGYDPQRALATYEQAMLLATRGAAAEGRTRGFLLVPAEKIEELENQGLLSLHVPRDIHGQPSSIGSIPHMTEPEGTTCKPCVFYCKSRCVKGVNCLHCHLYHDTQFLQSKRLRPSQKMRRRRREAAAEREGVAEEAGSCVDDAPETV